MIMMLKHLTDTSLLNDTKILVEKEQRLTLQVLDHLLEVDMRCLYSTLGFSNLFNYCVHELKYSSAEASLRISAVRLMKKVEGIEKKVEEGRINLTQLSQLGNFLNRQG